MTPPFSIQDDSTLQHADLVDMMICVGLYNVAADEILAGSHEAVGGKRAGGRQERGGGDIPRGDPAGLDIPHQQQG